MAIASSLRAELSSTVVNTLMIGAASSAMAAGLLAVVLGPLGLIALIVAPIDIGVAVIINRERRTRRERAVALAAGSGRGVAVVEKASPAPGSPRGGQSPNALTVAVEPTSGRPFQADAVVWWTAAVPGAWGVAAFDPANPQDVLVYFATGPETPAEMEAALNRETGQYRREPVLPDEPPTG